MKTVDFEKAYAVDCSKYIEKKDTGIGKPLSYLSWAWAWAKFKTIYPEGEYEVVKFDGLPYIADMNMGIIVYTRVRTSREDQWLEMWLPVMDPSNRAMRLETYSYKVWNRDKRAYEDKYVKAADMMDVNKTVMRCLTKNLAMFGLGLSIYAGEDVPQPLTEEETGAIKAEFESRKEKAGKPTAQAVKAQPAARKQVQRADDGQAQPQVLTMEMYRAGALVKMFDWLMDRYDANTGHIQPAAVERARASYSWEDGVLDQMVKDVEKEAFKNDINK